MGIYTNNSRIYNEAYDYASEIPANEAYNAAFGCAHVLADCQANDMALFESAIYDDMQEVMSIHEGYTYVNENAFTNVIDKIVTMFKKLIAKIKGIFKSFLAKIAGAFKNGHDLVKKYEKQIIKYANWKDFKIKGIRKPKGTEDIRGKIDSTFALKLGVQYSIKLSANNGEDAELATGISEFNDHSKLKDMDTDDIKEKIAKNYFAADSVKFSDGLKELTEDVTDYLYDEEDEIDGEDDKISGSYFSAKWIKDVLDNQKGSSKDWEKDVEKTSEKMDKIINKIIDDLNKTSDNLAKWRSSGGAGGSSDAKINRPSSDSYMSFDTQYRSKDTTDPDNPKDNPAGNMKVDRHTSVSSKTHDWTASDKNTDGKGITSESVQTCIQDLQKLASNEQEVITKVTSEYMNQVKFALGQARKIWTAAAAWSSGVHKESVEYYQALGEAAEEQFYMNMEAV